jgi:hypothetical protein
VVVWGVPRKPRHWLHLHDALAEIERSSLPFFDRRAIQELLGTSQTEAWRILRRLGAEPGPGGALMLPREVLIARLRAWLDDPEVQFEVDRRQRLETALDALNPVVRTRLVKVVENDPGKAIEIAQTRFARLPDGITFTPTSLKLEFRGSQNFLKLLAAVLKALENDTTELIAFMDSEAVGINKRLSS